MYQATEDRYWILEFKMWTCGFM